MRQRDEKRRMRQGMRREGGMRQGDEKGGMRREGE